MSKSKEPKDKQINLRLTAEEFNHLGEIAGNQGTTVTAHVLNSALQEHSSIYSKDFRNILESLNHAVMNLQSNVPLEQQQNLETEVHKLWQFLK